MTVQELLSNLINKENKEEKRVIFETLHKCSNLVYLAEKEGNFFPFLYVKGDRIVFTFMHEELDGLPYVYTDHHDIHTILQYIFFENISVYFCYEESISLSNEEIWAKIDLALSEGDRDKFHYFSSFIK